MPQTNVLSDWRATYPTDARCQQPGNELWTLTVGITAVTWATGNATYTTAAAHGLGVGASVTIANVNPSGYNGTFTTVAGTTGSTIVVAIASNPGTYVSGGAASVPSTFSSTLGPHAVPNKPTYAAGTVQNLEEYLVAVAEWDAQRAQEAAAEAPAEEEHEEVEEDDGNGGTVKRRRPRRR